MSYGAVVFDLDGTLIDSLEDLADAVNQALGINGFPPRATGCYKYFIGKGPKVMVSRALPEDKRSDDAVVEKCLADFNSIYSRAFNVKTTLYDGIPDLLNELSERGLKKAILTNKPHVFTEKYVENLLADWNFEVVIGQRDEIPRKPDPSGALRISRELGIDSSQMVYLGDSGVDMLTAVGAGMLPVGVLWGFRTGDELRENGAEHLIETPMELLSIIDL